MKASAILPGTGRGTATRSGGVEGYRRVVLNSPSLDHSLVPLHHLRWSPSPKGEDL